MVWTRPEKGRKPCHASNTERTVISTVRIQTINNKCGFAADTDMYTVSGEDYWEHKVSRLSNPELSKAGLNLGDLILKVNGQSCAELTHETFYTLCTQDTAGGRAQNGERELELETASQVLIGSQRLAVRGDSNV